jgi:hypothetical protein
MKPKIALLVAAAVGASSAGTWVRFDTRRLRRRARPAVRRSAGAPGRASILTGRAGLTKVTLAQ